MVAIAVEGRHAVTSRQGETRAAASLVTGGLCLGLALAALSVCGYRYGVTDQSQYLVQVIVSEQPDLLNDDPYVTVFGSLGSLFWPAIASVTSDANRSVVFLALTVVITALNAWLLVGIARHLLPGARRSSVAVGIAAAAVPLLLVVPREQNWFGLVSLGDFELTATLAVLPLVFLTILMWLRGRPVAALLAATLALPVHGQTGAYLLAATLAALAWEHRRSWRHLLGLGLVGLMLFAVGWRFLDEPMTLADQERYVRVGRDLFAPLVDPLQTPVRSWGAVAAVLLLGLATLFSERGDRTESQGRLVTWWAASALLPVIGLALLAAGVRAPWMLKLMVGRAIMLPQILAVIVAGAWCVRLILAERRLAVVGIGVLAVLALWPFPAFPSWLAALSLAGLTVVIVAVPLRGFTHADPAAWRRAASCVGAVLVVAAGIATYAFVQRPYPWLARGDSDAWITAQEWARTSTAPDTVFLTPPYLSGWRVGSHRQTYGEIIDGGLSFYGGVTLLDWADRMQQLGMKGPYRWHDAGAPRHVTTVLDPFEPERRAYQAAVSERIDRLQSASGAAYLVTEAAFDVPVGEVAYANDGFVVRRLAGERVAVGF